MKKSILISATVLLSISVFSQANDNGDQQGPKKIETIQIIDGDTVMHDVRIVESSGNKKDFHKVIRRERHFEGMDQELDSILKDIDIYIKTDDGHKRHIIKKIKMSDKNADDIIKELELDEDIVIEMKDGEKEIKIMKIRVNEDDVEEVITIETDKGGKNDRRRDARRDANPDGDQSDLRVFPNPAKEELNIEFEVLKGSDARLQVIGVNGKEIFSKVYGKPGKYTEKIKTENAEKGVFVVNLNQDGRSLSEKIILR